MLYSKCYTGDGLQKHYTGNAAQENTTQQMLSNKAHAFQNIGDGGGGGGRSLWSDKRLSVSVPPSTFFCRERAIARLGRGEGDTLDGRIDLRGGGGR